MIEVVTTHRMGASAGLVIDRAEAETPEAALLAARTLIADSVTAGNTRVAVSFFVDGKAVVSNVKPYELPAVTL